ncbi:hypothetical protein QAD02_010277 [Eretmocerus hayati]|uniref:Uncharacterized protein n=1 Tax=Eretmocerus hayati TaxID=131215 RepID=A0ACC2NE45_9HYME|nr:hypothetical protein QAD02_010277 [Eretmocerus hayati]
MSDAEVIESLENTNAIYADLGLGSEEDFDNFTIALVSRRNVKDAVHAIRSFFERSDVNFEDVNPAMMKIEDTVDQFIAQNLIQKRITEYFPQVTHHIYEQESTPPKQKLLSRAPAQGDAMSKTKLDDIHITLNSRECHLRLQFWTMLSRRPSSAKC